MKRKLLMFSILLFFISGCSSNKKDTKNSSVEMVQTDPSHSVASEISSKISEEMDQSLSQEKVHSEKNSDTQESSVSVNVNRRYTEVEKRTISNEFLEWAGERATMGGMAVNGSYFTHGASGRGDWYAMTTDGQNVLVQQQDPTIRNGKDIYPIHSLGGVVFYTSKYGVTGLSDEINDQQNHPSTATGFSEVANPDKPIVKYLLADNGIVYEFQGTASFTSGFYVTDDEGNFDYWPTEQVPFFVSEDTEAQEELQRILLKYN